MTELDLAAIKNRLRIFEGREWIDTAYIANAASFVEDVPVLVAELERLQRLLGDGPFPSSEAYENAVQALSDERARADLAEQERDGLAAEVRRLRAHAPMSSPHRWDGAR